MLVAAALTAAGATAQTAANRPPEVSFTRDGAIPVGPSATLMARGTDPDGDALTYRWELLEKPPGSAARIDSPETAAAGLRPDRPGVYRVRITVSDGTEAVVRTLRFDASPPGNGNPFKALPSPMRKPAAQRAKTPTTRPEPVQCPASDTAQTRSPVALSWHAPTSRVDGKLLPQQVRFRVYRATLPPGVTGCDAYRHCLRPLTTTPPGAAGHRQHFEDPTPPVASICYAVTTLSGSGHESHYSNLLVLSAVPNTGNAE